MVKAKENRPSGSCEDTLDFFVYLENLGGSGSSGYKSGGRIPCKRPEESYEAKLKP